MGPFKAGDKSLRFLLLPREEEPYQVKKKEHCTVDCVSSDIGIEPTVHMPVGVPHSGEGLTIVAKKAFRSFFAVSALVVAICLTLFQASPNQMNFRFKAVKLGPTRYGISVWNKSTQNWRVEIEDEEGFTLVTYPDAGQADSPLGSFDPKLHYTVRVFREEDPVGASPANQFTLVLSP